MFFGRFRVACALRMQRRDAFRRKDAETVELLTKALDSNLVLDEIDQYATDFENEYGDDKSYGLGEGNLLERLLTFIMEHWEEILKIILSLLSVMSEKDLSEGNRILAEDAACRNLYCPEE